MQEVARETLVGTESETGKPLFAKSSVFPGQRNCVDLLETMGQHELCSHRHKMASNAVAALGSCHRDLVEGARHRVTGEVEHHHVSNRRAAI